MRTGSDLGGTFHRHTSRISTSTGQFVSTSAMSGTQRSSGGTQPDAFRHSYSGRRWEATNADSRDNKSRPSESDGSTRERRRFGTDVPSVSSRPVELPSQQQQPAQPTESPLAQQMRRLLDTLEFLRQAHTVFDAQQQSSFTTSTLRLSDLGYRYHWRRILNSDNACQLAPYELLLSHALSNHGTPPNVASLSTCIEELEMFCFVNTSEVERRTLHAASQNNLALNECLLNNMAGGIDDPLDDADDGDGQIVKEEKTTGRKRAAPTDGMGDDKKLKGKDGRIGAKKNGGKLESQPRKSARLQQARLAAKQSVFDLDEERIPTQQQKAAAVAAVNSQVGTAITISSLTALQPPTVAPVQSEVSVPASDDSESKNKLSGSFASETILSNPS